jgi:hypothetical protein
MISYSTILHYYLPTRCLLKFEYQLPHPIIRTTLATDKKWPLSHSHISYQNSEISWPKMGLILVNKCQFQKKVLLKWYSSMKKIFRKFWIIFDIDQWPKLGLRLDVEAEIQILKVTYSLTCLWLLMYKMCYLFIIVSTTYVSTTTYW